MDGTPIGRRVFLGVLGVGVAGIVLGARAQDWFEEHLSPTLDRTPVGSLLPFGRFRIYTVTDSLPEKRKQEWRLRVHGLVERPFTIGYDELTALPRTHLTRDFQCVTGWRVQDVAWTGVSLGVLLDRAGVTSQAKALRFTSFDGTYTESLTLAQARRRDVIVAYGMEGGDISTAHGGPVRLYVAPMYGYKSIKWLDGIELTAKVQPGYWQAYGYDVDGWVGRSNGRDDEPT
jgi:DMSO/TMAO reductase YedYZ molybdopterin-dependent catalytic subunit